MVGVGPKLISRDSGKLKSMNCLVGCDHTSPTIPVFFSVQRNIRRSTSLPLLWHFRLTVVCFGYDSYSMVRVAPIFGVGFWFTAWHGSQCDLYFEERKKKTRVNREVPFRKFTLFHDFPFYSLLRLMMFEKSFLGLSGEVFCVSSIHRMGKRQYYVADTNFTLSPRNISSRTAVVKGMRSLFFDLAPHTDTIR